VATVSNGTVTGVAMGTATITVTANGAAEGQTVKSDCEVTVIHQYITGVSLNRDTLKIGLGKTRTLTAAVSPANATNKAVTWSSSDDSVATVNNGTVTAVAIGEATITVTTVDKTAAEGGETKTAQCAVTVSETLSTDIGNKDELSGLTAAQYFDEKEVYIGWNLGNAFDAGSGYGSWTRRITADFLPKIKDAGFNMVRIPVTWQVSSRPIGGAPNYTLNTTTLNDVAQVVDWAYDAGLVTIINIHHDDNGWLSMANLRNDTNRPAIYAQFTKVWEQLAEKFKDYGDWLIFEPFNEIAIKGGGEGNWGWYGNNNNSPEAIKDSGIINELNQKFTDTVRASTSQKNKERFLVVQPISAKPHQAMDSKFVLPTDTATGKQIVSMHFYEPESFCLSGGLTWSNKTDIQTKFASYATKFKNNGIPVILGEAGATYAKRSTAAERATAHANRLSYMEWMSSQAKANGIVPIYWDNGTIWASTTGENFGLWDRRNGGNLEVIKDADGLDMQDVIDAMINAVQ
jgi:aryl-phospho-beta-D-glucosidase BglC (GH1 family)